MKRYRLRLLPLTMLVAFLALGLKIGEVVHDGHQLIISLDNAAHAESAPEKKAEEPKKEDAAKHAEGESKPAAEAKEGGEGHEAGTEEEKQNKHEYNQVEVDLLQSLAQRRQELDNWGKQVQLKENMLIATEQRINEKIDNLQRMKKEIETLLAQYNEQEDSKIRSLVKMYENMKPKDAARIFEELDMPVLLTIVDRMSERKVSPILANMSPEKAKNLTVQLAEQHKLQKPRANAAENAASDAPAPDGTTPPAGENAPPPAPDSTGSGSSAAPSPASQPAPAR